MFPDRLVYQLITIIEIANNLKEEMRNLLVESEGTDFFHVFCENQSVPVFGGRKIKSVPSLYCRNLVTCAKSKKDKGINETNQGMNPWQL